MFRTILRSSKFPKHRPDSRYLHSRNAFVTRGGIARTVAGVVTASSVALATTIYADNNEGVKKDNSEASRPPLGSLVRAYFVFAACSVPWLVDAAPTMLTTLSSVPVVKQITEVVVRATFFNHFVGADTAEECVPLLRAMRKANKGVLFAYSVEVDENEATSSPVLDSPTSLSHADNAHKRIVDEMIHCIDVAADFEGSLTPADEGENISVSSTGRRTWVAIKMTALLPDARALIALSSHIVRARKNISRLYPEATVPFPGAPRIEDLNVILHELANAPSDDQLKPHHVQALRELYDDLVQICNRAKKRGVKVIVDAEYSWYQPAIDAFTLALMREFNSLASQSSSAVQPLVYNTFQAYLRRTPIYLAVALADAKANNYALGVKLVRGAYHPHELVAHEGGSAEGVEGGSLKGLSISPEKEPPVWREKRDTDEAYNRCVAVLVQSVKEDIEKAKVRKSIEKGGAGRGWFGSLFGGSNIVDKEQTIRPIIGVLFGTHNWTSCGLILEELLRNGLAARVGSAPSSLTSSEQSHDEHERALASGPRPIIKLDDQVVERVAIGQLYGMSDDLSDWIVSRTVSSSPFVLKYVPYGALVDVMPYLSRRAIENKSVLGGGGAAHERQRAGREIRRRLFG